MIIIPFQRDDLVLCADSLSHYPGFVWLDSNDSCHYASHYSTLAILPLQTWHNLNELKAPQLLWQQEQRIIKEDLPPFQGGFIGALSYDFGLRQHFLSSEKNSTPSWVGYYPNIISFDHRRRCGWIIIQDAHHVDPKRQEHAKKTLAIYQKALQVKQSSSKNRLLFTPWQQDTNSQDYQATVSACQNAIVQGDFFQANLTQLFHAKLQQGSPFQAYIALRKNNPAPFSAFLQCNDQLAIASISPEQFIQCHHKQVTTSPIKGTIAKHMDPSEDKRQQQMLASSEKDRAENIMIVDLMRNDLSLCCEDESIRAEKICQLETFSQVHHLVSKVTGQIKASMTPWDLLIQSIPGGSITGAPKIEAMRWLEQHESNPRSYYCGHIFAIGLDDYLNSSVLIRSIEFNGPHMHYGAGGAITLHSAPKLEYQEACLKARAFCQLIEEHS